MLCAFYTFFPWMDTLILIKQSQRPKCILKFLLGIVCPDQLKTVLSFCVSFGFKLCYFASCLAVGYFFFCFNWLIGSYLIVPNSAINCANCWYCPGFLTTALGSSRASIPWHGSWTAPPPWASAATSSTGSTTSPTTVGKILYYELSANDYLETPLICGCSSILSTSLPHCFPLPGAPHPGARHSGAPLPLPCQPPSSLLSPCSPITPLPDPLAPSM